MALVYATGTPSSVEDLVDKLQTFAAANGWTVDDYDATENECTIHEGSMYVHLGWDATGQEIAVCQSLGYTADNDIDAMPNDSGNGTSAITSQRRLDCNVAGPYDNYYIFAQDSAPKHIHVVVEVSSGTFRHFGFGTIDKINDWTGGEYAYAHIWAQGANDIDNPVSAQHVLGLDSSHAANINCATMHMEGVEDQGASEKWGVFVNSPTTGLDTAGEARRQLYGGMRGGTWSRYLSHIQNSQLNSYVPITPIPVCYRDTSTTPDKWIWLGQQPNIGIVNMANFSAGDTITLGGETWVVFPWVRKRYLEDNQEESWNAGIAYRKS